jgi:hypothetical protein
VEPLTRLNERFDVLFRASAILVGLPFSVWSLGRLLWREVAIAVRSRRPLVSLLLLAARASATSWLQRRGWAHDG